MDKQTHVTVRITREAHKRLRLIAAMLDKSIVEVVDALTEAKLAELQGKTKTTK